MAVHEVLVDAAGGLVEAGIELVEMVGACDGDGGDVDDRLAVGGHLEALEAALALGHLALLLRLDVHGEYLVAATEHQRVVVEPHGAELAGGSLREALLGGLGAVVGEQVELHVALVLLHADVLHAIDDMLAVGAHGVLADLSEAPHHLGGEAAVGDGDLVLLYRLFASIFGLAGGEAQRSGRQIQ